MLAALDADHAPRELLPLWRAEAASGLAAGTAQPVHEVRREPVMIAATRDGPVAVVH